MMDIDAMIKFLETAKEDGAHSVMVTVVYEGGVFEERFCVLLPKGRRIAVVAVGTADASLVERFYPPFKEEA